MPKNRGHLFALAILALLPAAAGEAGPATSPRVAVYVSEANFAEYHGILQTRLRPWLKANGCTVKDIGDAVAADPQKLRAFDAVAAASTYIVPETACKGLTEYVRSGGRLLWIDAPARTVHAGLRRVLGIGRDAVYRPASQGTFRIVKLDHPATVGLHDFDGSFIGNPATRTTPGGEVLVDWRGGDARFPGLVLTHTGKGMAVLINWIPWLTSGPQPTPEIMALLSGALDTLLAQWYVRQDSMVVRARAMQTAISQPVPVDIRMKVFARPPLAGRIVHLSAKLPGVPESGVAKGVAQLKKAGDVAFTAWKAILPTKGLDDGVINVLVSANCGDGIEKRQRVVIELTGKRMARLAEEDATRIELLAPRLRGTLGDYDREPRTPKGRVDIPRLITQIKTAHLNTYDWLIWHGAHDWEDLQAFLPEAQKLGIRVWVTVCPPSEQGGAYSNSEPFRLDFVRWAREIGALSRRYNCITAFVIDDFDHNRSTFTSAYVAAIATALRAQNAKVAFLPTVYWPTIGAAQFMADLRYSIDGIVFPYTELERWAPLRKQLTACRRWLGPNKLLMVNVYATGSGGGPEPGPRTPRYLTQVLTTSHELADGIRIYCLPKEKLMKDERFRTVAELFRKWQHGPNRPE